MARPLVRSSRRSRQRLSSSTSGGIDGATGAATGVGGLRKSGSWLSAGNAGTNRYRPHCNSTNGLRPQIGALRRPSGIDPAKHARLA